MNGYCRADGTYVRTDITGADSFVNSQETIKNIAESPQFMSECARTGHGKLLSVLPDQKATGNIFDRGNVQGYHEHIFFDASGENIGFFPNKEGKSFFGRLYASVASEGSIESKPGTYFEGYSYDSTCYDGATMRKALSQVVEDFRYNLRTFNCQDFVSMVLEKYKNLRPSS